MSHKCLPVDVNKAFVMFRLSLNTFPFVAATPPSETSAPWARGLDRQPRSLQHREHRGLHCSTDVAGGSSKLHHVAAPANSSMLQCNNRNNTDSRIPLHVIPQTFCSLPSYHLSTAAPNMATRTPANCFQVG